MILKKLLSFLMVICISCITIVAQTEKRVTVKKIRGEYTLVSDAGTTASEAKEKARDDAKRKAIETACGQKVKSWDVVESSAAGESYNSLSMIQVEGEILSFEIISEGVEQSKVRSSELVFYCIADVVVKKGVEPDPKFSVLVEEMKPTYVAGQSLGFTVLPLIDCYMTVFVFDNVGNCVRIYPNDNEQSVQLRANEKYSYPSMPHIEYTLFTDLDIETDRVVFVFTKKERPFQKDIVEKAEAEHWIALIPNDEKYLYYYVINILKQ